MLLHLSHVCPFSSKSTLGLISPLEEDDSELCAIDAEPEHSSSRSIPSPLPAHQSSCSPIPPPTTKPSSSNTHDWVQALLAEESLQTTSQPAPPTVSNIPTSASRPLVRSRRPNVPSVEQQLLDVLTQPPVSQRPHIPTEGEEMYFFVMSLVPRLNRLSRQSQIQAQMHFLEYLNELEEQEPALQRRSASHHRTRAAFHPYNCSEHHQT